MFMKEVSRFAVLSLLVSNLILGSTFPALAENQRPEPASPSVSGSAIPVADRLLIQGSTLCSNGTEYEPDSGVCAPINKKANNRKARFGTKAFSKKLPDLADLRRQQRLKVETKSNDPPIPDSGQAGVAAGITYATGQLQALETAALYTKMFIHPDGIDPTLATGDWYLFTVATNRTEKCVEFYALYWDDTQNLGLFDWSCSPEYPCQDGMTGPSHQKILDFSDSECNMTQLVDGDCNLQTAVYYANISRKLDNQDPPLWENVVYLWNYCTESWDEFYSHEFRANQKDCSLDSSCGWWGPILETPGNMPMIKTLGFQDTRLIHDGTVSELTRGEAYFTTPPAQWPLLYRDQNRSFTVGNYTTTVATNAATNIFSYRTRLNGTANAADEDTIVSFEWGLTNAYGQTVIATQSPVTAACTATEVSAILTDLSPNRTYHYRVKGVNSAGTSYGIDRTFTTAPRSDGCN